MEAVVVSLPWWSCSRWPDAGQPEGDRGAAGGRLVRVAVGLAVLAVVGVGRCGVGAGGCRADAGYDGRCGETADDETRTTEDDRPRRREHERLAGVLLPEVRPAGPRQAH